MAGEFHCVPVMAMNITEWHVIEARTADIMELQERVICHYCYLFAVRAKVMGH